MALVREARTNPLSGCSRPASVRWNRWNSTSSLTISPQSRSARAVSKTKPRAKWDRATVGVVEITGQPNQAGGPGRMRKIPGDGTIHRSAAPACGLLSPDRTGTRCAPQSLSEAGSRAHAAPSKTPTAARRGQPSCREGCRAHRRAACGSFQSRPPRPVGSPWLPAEARPHPAIPPTPLVRWRVRLRRSYAVLSQGRSLNGVRRSFRRRGRTPWPGERAQGLRSASPARSTSPNLAPLRNSQSTMTS